VEQASVLLMGCLLTQGKKFQKKTKDFMKEVPELRYMDFVTNDVALVNARKELIKEQGGGVGSAGAEGSVAGGSRAGGSGSQGSGKLELARTRRRRRLDVPPRFTLTARLGLKRRVDLAVLWEKVVRQVKATPMGLLVKDPGVAEVRRIGGTCRLFMEALRVGRVEGG
jgi:hypothetical protein